MSGRDRRILWTRLAKERFDRERLGRFPRKRFSPMVLYAVARVEQRNAFFWLDFWCCTVTCAGGSAASAVFFRVNGKHLILYRLATPRCCTVVVL